MGCQEEGVFIAWGCLVLGSWLRVVVLKFWIMKFVFLGVLGWFQLHGTIFLVQAFLINLECGMSRDSSILRCLIQ